MLLLSTIFPTPNRPANADSKTYTPPILPAVLDHLGSRLLPPAVDSFAVLYTKRLIRQAVYENRTLTEVNYEELRGAEEVFKSGRPATQFARIASGGRHKL